MTAPPRYGPYRIVLLHCGKFEYAEVEIDSPVHLIGPNNVGKTSLIALLQFLYIDNQKQMQFSREMNETRRYYFPEKYSFALFECLTPNGFQVVGVHGLGPVRQYEFERFIYSGRLDVGDFVDEEMQIREPEEIFRQLSVKELKRPIEPKHLRAALTGTGNSRNAFLGLVPARHSNTYTRFRKVFGNILRLSHIRQDELKQLLLDIYDNEFQQSEIDLARNYATGYKKVLSDSREVQELKRLQTPIERLLSRLEQRDDARKALPALWRALGEAYEAQKADLGRRESELLQQSNALKKQNSELKGRIKASRSESLDFAGRHAILKKTLDDLAAKRNDFEGFMPEWKRQRLMSVKTRLEELVHKLGNAEDEPVEQLKRRIKTAAKKLEEKKIQLDNLANAAVNYLREHFSDGEIADMFAVLNPGLLALSVNDKRPGIGLPDSRTAKGLLRELLAHRNGRILAIRNIELHLDALDKPDLDAYTDPEIIREEIGRLDNDIRRYSETLQDAMQVESLRKEKMALEREMTKISRELDAYQEFCEQVTKEPIWKEELAELKAKEQTLQEQIEKDEQRCTDLEEKVRKQNSELEVIKKKRTELDIQVHALQKPDEDWPLLPVEEIPAEWETLIFRYKKTYDEQQTLDREVRELLEDIESQTYGRYTGEDEAATINALREQLEIIPTRETAVERMWRGIAVGIKKDLRNIGKDLDTLKGLVSGLNRQLGKFSISNLALLKLTVVERPQWVRRIREIAIEDEMPLFGDRRAAEEALSGIGQLLQDHPHVDLKDLFELSFEVGTPDGKSYRHQHLDAIESNGTTIAIKVLVNLTLLREILGDAKVQVPFYLDECSSLDRSNLTSIVKAARRMGFIAVLASPDAMDVADNLYFMQEEKDGRVVLDTRSSMVKIKSHPPAEDMEEVCENA